MSTAESKFERSVRRWNNVVNTLFGLLVFLLLLQFAIQVLRVLR